MAEIQLIDLSNYDTMLVQSSQSRSGTPDGNIYFDTVNGKVEFITKQELTQVDLGSGMEDNPLDEELGIKLEAAYAFENQERRLDESLRKTDKMIKGSFKFAGAYNFVNSNKPSTPADRNIIRGSGWSEFAKDGGIDRIYFGNTGLSNIEPTSQPYYMLSSDANPDLNTLTPVDFAKAGNFNESVQVFGSTSNAPSDSTAGNFDTRAFESVSVRTFGKNPDRKSTTLDLGIAELGGYATGFAVNESDHLTTGNYALADVFGGSQIAPFTGLSLEEKDSAVTISGFNEADGDFTWVLNNTAGATLDECIAFLDALAQTDDDINAHATNETHGKRVGTWYSYNALSQIVTRSGADDNGLYIYNIPISDEQRVIFTNDAGSTNSMPFSVSLSCEVGSVAKSDPNAWYHSFGFDDFGTSGAITVMDSSGNPVKGDASAADANNKINFGFDYDGDTVLGGAGTDKDCVFLCEGDGGATQAKTLYSITRTSNIAFACIPNIETNA